MEVSEQVATARLTGTEAAIRDAVAGVVAVTVAPVAGDIDREERFPDEGYQALASAGLAAIPLPADLGGSGQSMLA
jgi:isovaleryl-CoA dehydrogenase